MKTIIAAVILLTGCATIDQDQQDNERAVRRLRHQLAQVESVNDHLQYRLDVETYRHDIERCGRNRQCRVNTYRAWKLLFQEHNLWSAK